MACKEGQFDVVEHQFQAFSINFNAENVNGMTLLIWPYIVDNLVKIHECTVIRYPRVVVLDLTPYFARVVEVEKSHCTTILPKTFYRLPLQKSFPVQKNCPRLGHLSSLTIENYSTFKMARKCTVFENHPKNVNLKMFEFLRQKYL